MKELSKQDLERIVKAVVNWNGQEAKFDRRYLELQDNSTLIVEEEDGTITLKTKF